VLRGVDLPKPAPSHLTPSMSRFDFRRPSTQKLVMARRVHGPRTVCPRAFAGLAGEKAAISCGSSPGATAPVLGRRPHSGGLFPCSASAFLCVLRDLGLPTFPGCPKRKPPSGRSSHHNLGGSTAAPDCLATAGPLLCRVSTISGFHLPDGWADQMASTFAPISSPPDSLIPLQKPRSNNHSCGSLSCFRRTRLADARPHNTAAELALPAAVQFCGNFPGRKSAGHQVGRQHPGP